jgi:diguanylate cyclase (GGDEF)-like protein
VQFARGSGDLLLKTLKLLCFPSGLVAVLTCASIWRCPPAILEAHWLQLLPLPVYGAVFWLAWRFQRSRFIQIGVLLLSCWVLGFGRPISFLKPDESEVALQGFAVLIPVILGIVCWLRDRGILSRRGLFGFAVIGLAVAAVVGSAHSGALEGGLKALNETLLGLVEGFDLPATEKLFQLLGPAATFSFVFATLSLALCFYRRRSQVEVGFFWILILSGIACSKLPLLSCQGAVDLFCVSSGVILFVAMVEQFHGLAYRDELTGLLSRRALQDKMAGLGRNYAMAMVDIDHFKRFNDRFGHDAGDELLRLVAAQLQAAGGGSSAYRFGGEEFTLIFPGRTAEEAEPHLENLREAIKNRRFTPRHWTRPRKKPVKGKAKRKKSPKSVGVTVSIGCSMRSTEASTPEQVLKRADEALYKAKRGGRNRVVLKE